MFIYVPPFYFFVSLDGVAWHATMKTYEDLANRIAQLERRILGAPRETQPQRQAGLVAQLTACKARLDALMRGSEGEAFFKTCRLGGGRLGSCVGCEGQVG